MGIQSAIRASQLALRGGQLSATVDDFPHGLNALLMQWYRPDQLKVELAGRVSPPGREHGVDGTAQCRVQNRCIPTPMQRAHGVQVLSLRAALKNYPPLTDVDDVKIQVLSHGGRRCCAY